MADDDGGSADLTAGDVGGTPQDETAAGGTATSGNSTDGDSSSVGVDNTSDQHDGARVDDDADELEVDPDDDDDDRGDGDELPGGELSRARRQAARYRRQVRELETRADDLEGSLWRARLELDGRLADPDDLPLDRELVDDPDGIREAVDALLERKPHLRSRRIRERAGQGEGTPAATVSLAELLARGA